MARKQGRPPIDANIIEEVIRRLLHGDNVKNIVNDLPVSKSTVYDLRKGKAPVEQRGPADKPTGGA